MANTLRRREFLRRAALAGTAASAASWTGGRAARGADSPNEKLNIGVIGTANRAAENIKGVQGENIVAICDIDDALLGKAKERFPAPGRTTTSARCSNGATSTRWSSARPTTSTPPPRRRRCGWASTSTARSR